MSNTSNHSLVSKGIAVMSFSLLSLCAINTAEAQDTTSHEQSIPKEIGVMMGAAVAIDRYEVENYTVTGTVLDEENQPLPGVNIVLKGTAVGTQTDFDGKFEFPQALEVDDVLVFSYIGFKPQEFVIKPSESKTIDINITFNYSDISLMGEVDVVVVGGAYASKRNIFQKFADLFRK